jgi:putative transposase
VSACQVLCTARSSQHYQSVAQDRSALRIRLRDLAAVRVRYGYRRLHILLQREGLQVNHKLVYRVYRQEGLGIREASVSVAAADEGWSVDLMADQLFSGQRFRLLTIVDNFTRESLAIAQRASSKASVRVDKTGPPSSPFAVDRPA